MTDADAFGLHPITPMHSLNHRLRLFSLLARLLCILAPSFIVCGTPLFEGRAIAAPSADRSVAAGVHQVPTVRRHLPPAGKLMHDVSSITPAPSTVITWATRYDHHNVHMLALLVVWRGSDGWHSRGAPESSSGGGGERWFEYTIRDGGLDLKVRFDAVNRIAEMAGRKLALRDDNVILVDGVASPSGPKVVGTLRIDPKLATGPDGFPVVADLWTRSPEIVSFLKR
jgi:hypothetical protein